MGIDKRGSLRLHCSSKNCDCQEYDAPKEGHNCNFCDCKPTKHRLKGEIDIPLTSSCENEKFDEKFMVIEEEDNRVIYLNDEAEIMRKLSEGARLLEEEDKHIFGAVNKYNIFQEGDHIYFSCAVCGVKHFMSRSKREANIIGLKNLNLHRDTVGHRFNVSIAAEKVGEVCHNKVTNAINSHCNECPIHKRKHVFEIATIFEKNK